MPIHLHTGLPGHGKTLFTLWYIKKLSERENRPVYYHNINSLTLPWELMDPYKWMDVPPNSIIVIDEAQDIYRPRANSAAVPEHVAALEKHRHGGVDIYMITQHPMLVDPSVRRLTDQHRHIVRKWGGESGTMHQWTGVKPNCEQPAGRVDSEKTSFVYPKELYGCYKSAEVHTIKRQIPKRVWFFLFLCAALVALVYAGYRVIGGRIMGKTSVPQTAQAVRPDGSPLASGDSSGTKRASYKDAVADARQYAFERMPRVGGLDSTAPRYDEVTKPVTAPVPVACVTSKSKGCLCYSQQGTRMAVDPMTCTMIVERGFFVDFDDKGGRPNGVQQTASAAATNHFAPPVVAADAVRISSPAAASAVGNTASLEDGYGVLGKSGQRAPQYR